MTHQHVLAALKQNTLNTSFLRVPTTIHRGKSFSGACCKLLMEILVVCQIHKSYVYSCMATVLATRTVVRWLNAFKLFCFVHTYLPFDSPHKFFQWAASPAGRVPSDGSGSWPVVAAAAVICVISLCCLR